MTIVWENRMHATQDPIHFWTWISDRRVTENASKHSGLKIQHGAESGKQIAFKADFMPWLK